MAYLFGMIRFADRKDAARALVPLLEPYREASAVLLAIPRGGIPLAVHLAQEFDFPVELLMTKKIGHPDNPEYAIGAVSLTDHLVDDPLPVSQVYIDQQVVNIRQGLREKYRLLMGDRKPATLENRILIIVDDGVATGKTILSAIPMLRKQQPKKIVVAVPVASKQAASLIEAAVDAFICPYLPPFFRGVGEHYGDFSAVDDETCVQLLSALR